MGSGSHVCSLQVKYTHIILFSLQVSTITGQNYTGTLLIHDPTSQTVVLSSQARTPTNNGVSESTSSSSASLVDLQIIKISSIRDVRILSTKQEGFKPYEAKPITLADFKAREELAQKRALEEERRLGIGVTHEAQMIFDAFAKTYLLL